MDTTKRNKLTKDDVIEKILLKQKQINAPLKQCDFANPNDDEIGMGLIKKYFGSFNNMKKKLGLEIIQEDMRVKHKTNDELLSDLNNFIKELGRLPTSYEIEENKNMLNRSAYNKAFGGISKAFNLLGYIPNKKSISFNMSNDEIVEIYKDFFEEIGYVPSFDFCRQIYKLPAPRTVLRRLNCTWNQFVISLGCKPNEKIATTNICKASDGTICFSSAECFIHNFLLLKDIDNLEKETFYRDILEDGDLKIESGYKRFDWTFTYEDNLYLVEYFGLMDKENYRKRHDEKLELLTKDNKLKNLISVYPKDIKRLNDIFDFIN